MDPVLLARLARQLEKCQTGESAVEHVSSAAEKQLRIDPVLAKHLAARQEKNEQGECGATDSTTAATSVIGSFVSCVCSASWTAPAAGPFLAAGTPQMDPELARRLAQQQRKVELGWSKVEKVGSAATAVTQLDPELAKRLAKQMCKVETGHSDVEVVGSQAAKTVQLDPALAIHLERQRNKTESGKSDVDQCEPAASRRRQQTDSLLAKRLAEQREKLESGCSAVEHIGSVVTRKESCVDDPQLAKLLAERRVRADFLDDCGVSKRELGPLHPSGGLANAASCIATSDADRSPHEPGLDKELLRSDTPSRRSPVDFATCHDAPCALGPAACWPSADGHHDVLEPTLGALAPLESSLMSSVVDHDGSHVTPNSSTQADVSATTELRILSLDRIIQKDTERGTPSVQRQVASARRVQVCSPSQRSSATGTRAASMGSPSPQRQERGVAQVNATRKPSSPTRQAQRDTEKHKLLGVLPLKPTTSALPVRRSNISGLEGRASTISCRTCPPKSRQLQRTTCPGTREPLITRVSGGCRSICSRQEKPTPASASSKQSQHSSDTHRRQAGMRASSPTQLDGGVKGSQNGCSEAITTEQQEDAAAQACASTQEDAAAQACASRTSCKAPTQIAQEVQRALVSSRVTFKKVSAFHLRCDKQSVRFEVEISRSPRIAGSHVVRLRRVAGAVAASQKLFSRVLGEMRI